jgi:SAM-dependent methyltransferase
MPFIPQSSYLDNYFSEESHFCQLYPLTIQQLDRTHWSPLIVAYKACQFLADRNGVKILDIGSGVGKFCFAGAYYKPSAFFYGVEQREYLVELAQKARGKLGRMKVTFEHKNFTQMDFDEFDSFYFYNSFFENLEGTNKIDDTIEYSLELYDYYNRFLIKKLSQKSVGTKLATYQSFGYEIPSSYVLVDTQMNGELKFWIKHADV